MAAPILINPAALRLDGDDDYVEIQVRTLPRAEAPKTIAVWFRNSATSPRLRNMVALFNEPDDAGIHLGFDGGQLAAWRWGDFDPILISPGSPDGSWHHAAYTLIPATWMTSGSTTGLSPTSKSPPWPAVPDRELIHERPATVDTARTACLARSGLRINNPGLLQLAQAGGGFLAPGSLAGVTLR